MSESKKSVSVYDGTIEFSDFAYKDLGKLDDPDYHIISYKFKVVHNVSENIELRPKIQLLDGDGFLIDETHKYFELYEGQNPTEITGQMEVEKELAPKIKQMNIEIQGIKKK